MKVTGCSFILFHFLGAAQVHFYPQGRVTEVNVNFILTLS